MSYLQWQKFYTDLEDGIKNNRLTFEEAMSLDRIIPAIKQKLPNLISFIQAHYKELINRAISKDDNDVINARSLAILLENEQLKSRFSRDPEFINYLIEKFNENIHEVHLLAILRGIVEFSSSLVLNDIKSPKEFFELLLSKIDQDPYYEFVSNILSDQTFGFAKAWLNNLHIDVYLYKLFSYPETIARRSLNLLTLYLKSIPHNKTVLERILNESKIKEIIDLAINSPTQELSSSSLGYLYALTKTFSKEELDSIITLLQESTNKIIEYIKRDKTFLSDKKYAIGIIKFIMKSDNYIEKEIIDFLIYFFEVFIECKTNSFLHLAFLSLFKALHRFEPEFIEFVKVTNMMAVLIDVINKREKIISCFWGQIDKMIELINGLVVKGKLEKSTDWEQYINGEYRRKKLILSTKYGGETPNKIDDEDPLAAAFPYKDSSSDLSSESEEEDDE